MGDLTDVQRTALEMYALSADRLNAALRGTVEMSSSLRLQAEAIRSAMKPTGAEFRATRAVPLGSLDVDSPTDLVGTELVESAFLSVSGKQRPPSPQLRDPNSVVLELLIGPDVPARGVRELAEFPLEDEMIVIDGASIYVVGARFDESLQRWRLFGIVEA